MHIWVHKPTEGVVMVEQLVHIPKRQGQSRVRVLGDKKLSVSHPILY